MYQSILNYENAKYGRYALYLIIVSVVLYIVHDPVDPPNGGTWLGYTLGTISALLIIWLTWFGVRKRQYRSTSGTVNGWLSAHVYLGSSLIVVGTLHSAGQLGWNIHSVSYLLMILVIISGFLGVYLYRQYPALIMRNRQNQPRRQLFEALAELEMKSSRLATKISPEIASLISSAIAGTTIGGGVMDQILGRDTSKLILPDRDGHKKPVDNHNQETLIQYLTGQMAVSKGGATTLQYQELVELSAQRKNMLTTIRKDIQLQAKMQLWLYFHVPVTFALLTALTAHIVSVFLYW